ncbi:MAG: outer membrane beta-barrel family protein [Bacteroidota bacterium]
MSRFHLVLVLGLSMVSSVFSQTFEITGSVVNTEKTSIPFANVLLLNISDTTIVKGTSADSKGFFKITGVVSGEYLLQASYVQRTSKIRSLTVNQNLAMGNVIIPDAQENLEEVEVIAKKPIVKRLSDRLVFLVENTVVSQGNTWDILRNTPGLIVNQNELNIRGKSANIYLNGRRVQLSPEESKDFFESLSGTAVEAVELYANPPANFDAQDGAVLNIITNKGVAPGYKGSIDAAYTQAIFPKYRLGTAHYFKSEKLNLFVNYNYNDKQKNVQQDKGVNYINDINTIFSRWDTDENREGNVVSHSANFNLDYDLDDSNRLSVTSNLLFTPNQEWQTNLNTEIRNNQNVLDSTFTTANRELSDETNLAFDALYVHKFKNPGAQLSVNGHYTAYTNDFVQQIASNYFDASGIFLREFGFQTDGIQDIEILTGQIDFSTPIENASLETGVKVSVVDSESAIAYSNFNGSDETVSEGLSDVFNYDEKVYAAYLSYVQNWEKWSVKLGVRGELTDAAGISQTLNQTNTQNFFEPFPTLYVLYSLNEKHSFSLDYGRKVGRPRYDDLNPFRFFNNENDFLEGNQTLQPNFSNNFNINYSLNSEYFFDFYYRDNGNYLSPLVFQDNKTRVLRRQKQNVLGSISYGLDFTVSKSILDPWFLYAYTSIFHEEETFLALESGNQEFTNSIDGFFVYLASYLTLSADGTFSGELTFSHMSNYLFGSYIQDPYTNFTLGVRKTLWNNSAIISITAEDLLGRVNSTLESRYLNQNNFYFVQPETQFVRVGFTYNFGNFRLKQNQRKIEKDERDRLGRSSGQSLE